MIRTVIASFGYLHAAPPQAHITLDLRKHFRDPHVSPDLRYMTAFDEPVQRAVRATPGIPQLTEAAVAAVIAFLAGPSAADLTVAVGCAGGRHRAAVVAADIASALSAKRIPAQLVHRDLHQPVVER